ncbi:MAG: N-6 DNA methylase, partial [Thermoguttaceae bacterium]
MERLEACFGARSAFAAETLGALGGAFARKEPAGFAAWREAAERLYGAAFDTAGVHRAVFAPRAEPADRPLPFDQALFARQAYFALIVRRVAAELCGEVAAGSLDEPVFACASKEAASVVARLSAAAAACCAEIDWKPALPASDLFKRLYESVFPRALRHALGEYYTPDWLADYVLEQAGWPGEGGRRLLDPSCGSGTFLVAAIRELRGEACPGIGREEQLDRILQRVAGFDLNPLAVLTARANYLVAVRDLLPDDRPVRVPVACCDTICDGPPDPTGGEARPFDLLVGNPPWIAWDNLPASYRRATLPL